MTKLFSSLLVVALLAAGATPASARRLLIRETVRCDLDGDGTFGNLADNGSRRGIVRLFDDGTFTFKMKASATAGLAPGTQFSCRLTCAGNGANGPNGANDPAVANNCGTTEADGDADFEVLNFRENSANPQQADEICLGPVFEIFETAAAYPAGDLCKNGFGTGGAGI